MDFGIAKVFDRSRTRTAVMMGTPAYMSPEQIRAPASVDARTDLFAVGCILYEMLSGQPAFDGDTEFDIQTRIVQGRFEPLRRRLSALPPRLDAVVQKALAVDAEERFASAAAFIDALSSREPVASPPPAPPPQQARVPLAAPARPRKQRRPIEFGVFSFGRRRRLVLATLAMCVGAVIGSQVPSLMESTEVWDTVQADLGVSRSVGVLAFAGSGGVIAWMFGYWLIEIGCLVFLSVIGLSVFVVFLEAALP